MTLTRRDEKIKRSENRLGSSMRPLARPLLSLALMVVTWVTGALPAPVACGNNSRPMQDRERTTCRCGTAARSTEGTCCRQFAAKPNCCCAAKSPGPATPSEPRSAQDRNEDRRGEGCSLASQLGGSLSAMRQLTHAETAVILPPQPTLLRQARLCRWIV